MKNVSNSEFSHGDSYFNFSKPNTELIDFSSSINQSRKELIGNEFLKELEHYPQPENVFEKKIAQNLDLNEEKITVFAGMTSLIYSVFKLSGIKRALFLEPLFSEYMRSSLGMGIESVRLPVNQLLHNPKLLRSFNYDIACLNNPVNPTGEFIDKDNLIELIEECQRSDSLFFLDEAYIDFISKSLRFNSIKFLDRFRNLIIGRSFTKIGGLPGIRLGYSVTSEDLGERLKFLRPPWTIPQSYLKVDISKFFDIEIPYLEKERDRLIHSLRELGLRIIGNSVSNMISFSTENLIDPDQFERKLVDDGFLVRNLSNFYGFNHNEFRIGVKTPEDNKKLISAIKRILDVKG